MHNLVQSSIRHNSNGCTITITLQQVEWKVQLIVADNGIGASEEKLQELRTKSHYMESTDEKLGLRHGLGLLIVRRVVQAHGGELEIDGALHEGFSTTITF